MYGKGFRGAVDLKIKGLAQVRALALFGKTTPIAPLEGYRYFFVDAMATFDKGIPIFTGVNLNGLGGGVYHRMSRDTTNYTGFNVNPPSILTLPVGASLSGIKYVPDDNKGIGIKLSVIIASQGSETAFNANATFEILFNSQKAGGGVSDMWLYGIAQFMSAPDKGKTEGFQAGQTPPPPKYANTIAGYVDMHYNFNAKEFNGLINAYINTGNGAIRGGYANNLAGAVEMRFSPNTWYINIGRPDKRISLLATVPGTSIGLNLSAYLDIGKNIPPMPPLPSNVTSLLGQSNFLTAESQRASGKGFAFGAAVEFHIPRKDCCLGVQLFYGEFHAGAGFDIMMQNYGKTTICTNTGQPIGINGWYAAGQMYAYIQGKIGIYALGKTYPIMDIGAAALLQAKLPNPFWAKGVVGGRYRILGGLVKGDCRFQFEIGQSCAIAGNSGGGAAPIQDPLIVDINPLNQDSSVSVLDKPNAQFSIPVHQMTYQNNIFREIKITKSSLRDLSTNQEIPGEIAYKDNKTAMTYEPFELLRANTVYKYELTATEYENSNYKRADHREVTFKTGEALTYIPSDNVVASYPMNGMYNLYVNESSKGFIELKNGQSNILSNVPNGYIPEVVFRNSETNIVARTAFTYNAYTRVISFVLPWLPKEKTLKMDVQFTPNEPNANPKILYTAVFRTSMYSKFIDKINAMKSLMTTVAQPNSKVKEFKTMLPEPFDEIEINGKNGEGPLIDFVSRLTGNGWLENEMANFLYSNVPVTIKDKDINLAWKNVSEKFSKPTTPDGGLELIQIENTSMVTVSTNQVGQILTLNPEQKLRFELIQVVDDDYAKVKLELKSMFQASYEECMADYCKEDKLRCKKYAATKYAGSGADNECEQYAEGLGSIAPKLIEIARSDTYPQPPAVISSTIDIQYRLPGKGGVTTVTSIVGQN